MRRVIGNFSDGDDEFRCRENLPNLWRKVYPCCCHHFILTTILRCFVQNQSQNEADASNISSQKPSPDSPDGLSNFQENQTQSEKSDGTRCNGVSSFAQNGEKNDSSAADAQKNVLIEKFHQTLRRRNKKAQKTRTPTKRKSL